MAAGVGNEAAAEEEPDAELPGDVLATRAWRAAVIGLFTCPPLLHFYSAWTLLRLTLGGHPLSRSGIAKFYAALALDAAVCAVAGVFVLMFRGF
jgi:hypothetical protein